MVCSVTIFGWRGYGRARTSIVYAAAVSPGVKKVAGVSTMGAAGSGERDLAWSGAADSLGAEQETKKAADPFPQQCPGRKHRAPPSARSAPEFGSDFRTPVAFIRLPEPEVTALLILPACQISARAQRRRGAASSAPTATNDRLIFPGTIQPGRNRRGTKTPAFRQRAADAQFAEGGRYKSGLAAVRVAESPCRVRRRRGRAKSQANSRSLTLFANGAAGFGMTALPFLRGC